MIGLLLLVLRVAFFVLTYGLLFWLLRLIAKDLRLPRPSRRNAPERSSRRAKSGAHIVVSAGTDHAGNRIIPIDHELIIGRDPQCGLRMTDSSISSMHARIYAIGDEYFVEDLGSTNGTVVGGEKIAAPSRIRSGDIISLGRSVLVFREES